LIIRNRWPSGLTSAPVLFAQEVDDIALLSLKPAKEGYEQEME